MKNTRLRLSSIRRVWDGLCFLLCVQVPWGVGDPIRCTHRSAGNWATVYVAEFLIVLRTEDVSLQVMWNSAIRWWKSCYENLPLGHGTCWARCLYEGGFGSDHFSAKVSYKGTIVQLWKIHFYFQCHVLRVEVGTAGVWGSRHGQTVCRLAGDNCSHLAISPPPIPNLSPNCTPSLPPIASPLPHLQSTWHWPQPPGQPSSHFGVKHSWLLPLTFPLQHLF